MSVLRLHFAWWKSTLLGSGTGAPYCSNRAIVSCFGVKMGYETPLDRLVQKSWGNNWLRWKENLTDETRLIWKKICWCLITCGEKNFLPRSLMSCPNGCCVCLILKYVWVRTCMQIEVHFFFWNLRSGGCVPASTHLYPQHPLCLEILLN